MKKLKRALSLLLAAVLMLTMAGCADEGKSFTTDEITVWIWDESQLEAWQAIADSWTEQTHISVRITVKDEAAYWQEVERGMLPDILWMDSQHLQTCVQGNMLLRLDDMLKSGSLNMSDYDSQVMESFQVDGYTYAVPKDSSVMALWYNKMLFDAVDAAYPDETWTWEDLAQASEALTNRHAGKYGIAIDITDTSDGWYNLLYAYGGAVLTTDEDGQLTSGWGSSETSAAMGLLAGMICSSMPSQPTMSRISSYELFTSGNVAMLIQSGEEAMSLIREDGAENWACTLLPYCDRDGSGDCGEGERVSMLEGNGWVISSMASDSVAAFDLLETFCSKESQQKMAEGSISQPAMTSLAESWCTSIEGWDFTPYTKTLNDSELISAPIQTAAESWQDYAASTTLYVAWNDPARMDEMLQKQDEYTLSDLARGQSSGETTETGGEEENEVQNAGAGEEAG